MKPSVDQTGTLVTAIMALLGTFGLAERYGITGDQVLAVIGVAGAALTWIRHGSEKGRAVNHAAELKEAWSSPARITGEEEDGSEPTT